MPDALTVKNATKYYGEKAIFKNLSVKFRSGEITVLCGPSGIGKSTLLRCLILLETPNFGEILVGKHCVVKDGIVLNEPLVRKKMGIIFQDLYLWDNKTVLHNLTESLIYGRKLAKREAHEAAFKVSRQLSLDEALLQNYPPHLSRGQRQRVAIARTLLTDPEIILLDEPTASLDSERVDELVKILFLLRSEGRTLVVVTHDLDFAQRIGDKVIDVFSSALPPGLAVQSRL